MHINIRVFQKRIYGPDWLTLREMAAFAILLDLEPEFMLTFIARNRNKDLQAEGGTLKKTLFKH